MGEKGTSPIDNIKSFFYKHITRFDIVVFLCSFVFSLLTHMYMFTNITLNHDNVDGLFSDCAFGLSSGRWLLHLITEITGDFSSPWFDGIIGAIFLSLGVVFILKFFNVKRYLPALLAAFALVSFPTIACTYSYMFNSAQDLFALFMAALGAYLIRTNKLLPMLAGSLLITLGMGCYQAYFCLAALLLVIAVVSDAVTNRYEKASALVLNAFKYVGLLALSMAMYFVILKLLLAVTGTELVAYSGMDNMGVVSVSQMLDRVREAYINCRDYYLNEFGIYNDIFTPLAFIAFAVSLVAIVVLTVKNKVYKRPLPLLVILAMIAIFPLATFLCFLMTDKSGVHQLMFYPAVIPLILPCVYMDKITLTGKKLRDSVLTALTVVLIAVQALIGYEFAFVTNRAYTYMNLTYENVYAYYTKLTAKIEMTEGYTKETPVALIGYTTSNIAVPNTNLTGIYTDNFAFNLWSRNIFLHYYLASPIYVPSQAEIAEIQASEQFINMPCYPADGSIQKINNIIAVKLS